MALLNWLKERLATGSNEGGYAMDAVLAQTGEQVDALLRGMVNQPKQPLILGEGTLLPGMAEGEGQAGDDIPVKAILNRLKVMCGLDPMSFKDVRKGTITIDRGHHSLVYRLEFNDQTPACLCRIEVDIRRRKAQ